MSTRSANALTKGTPHLNKVWQRPCSLLWPRNIQSLEVLLVVVHLCISECVALLYLGCLSRQYVSSLNLCPFCSCSGARAICEGTGFMSCRQSLPQRRRLYCARWWFISQLNESTLSSKLAQLVYFILKSYICAEAW